MEKRIPAIKNGIVIDHIPVESTLKVLDLLDLGNELIALGNNLGSNKMGKKGVVKISDKYLTKQELDKISILGPEVTISIIKKYKVVEKRKADIPKIFEGVLTCFNPQCVTRHELVKTVFYVVSKDPLKVRCHYCENTFQGKQIKI